MPPHLHPRSRSTTGLFAGTLLASLMVVGIPHVFPCPAPRRTFADSEMIMTTGGQQIQRVRRRRRKDVEPTAQDESLPARTPLASEEEVSTFLQLEEEAALLSKPGRECPIPKPTGMLDTEIDWTTYMQQIRLFLDGERNYILIKGSTGPLVYPAAHVYSYTLLHHLTDEGRDIAFGQIIFAFLYLITLTIVMACYRRSGAPPYLFPLLVLSKRLHSIYMLRLFNDGLAALCMWISIWFFINRKWTAGVVVWSFGLGIKMTLILLAPAIIVLLALSLSVWPCIRLAALGLGIQVMLAIPFLPMNPQGYFNSAFEFGRQFMYKWTVNWRFIPEDIFLSPAWWRALIIVHALILVSFGLTSFLRPAGINLFAFLNKFCKGQHRGIPLHHNFIMAVLLTCLSTGFLCARSLHYQFFAYLSWATPYLLWRTGAHPVIVCIVWLLQEIAWNTYPSTNISSAIVVLSLVAQVAGVFANRKDAFPTLSPTPKEHAQ
ncbi:putative alpha-1,3-mannosyltransferase [Aspergillus pseudoustus]|uniref:Dol-P-Man:Man(5)GlcNAc(2)-PP-Dol alpha-1,3-mannosyltransferase n=1 Tax=Aspergillus pseudoustus TaxID=1810923 RepID=A0ABR4JPF4_9EURO